MDMTQTIQQVVETRDLSYEQMQAVMTAVMSGEATPAQIAGLLVGLRMKGETVDEISAAAQVMRSFAETVTVAVPYLVDTCGTGGDGASTFNVSTISAVVAAAAGACVAKHGNRSVSSSSGSADVLKAAGVNLEMNPQQVARCIEHVGIGFLFAPMHHKAMKHAIGPRRELGVRTLFNILGPLTNPAHAPNQVLGVYDRKWLRPLAEVLRQLDSRHVLLVHAQDGLDEISIASNTWVCELREGQIQEYSLDPQTYGLRHASLEACIVGTVEESLGKIQQVLRYEKGPALDMVLLNAGAAVYVSGLTGSLENGIQMAEDAIASGLAQEKFQALIQFTQLPSEPADD